MLEHPGPPWSHLSDRHSLSEKQDGVCRTSRPGRWHFDSMRERTNRNCDKDERGGRHRLSIAYNSLSVSFTGTRPAKEISALKLRTRCALCAESVPQA